MNKLVEFISYGFNLGVGTMAAIGGLVVGIIVLCFVIGLVARLINWLDKRKRNNNRSL